jgi:hypothetical protein
MNKENNQIDINDDKKSFDDYLKALTNRYTIIGVDYGDGESKQVNSDARICYITTNNEGLEC